MARPRDAAVDAKILEAARRCVAERGAAALTIDEVARRAGVGKTAIYRRWSGRAQLLFELTVGAVTEEPMPDTGSVVDDLSIALQRLVESLEAVSRPVMAERVGAMIADEQFFRDVWTRQAEPVARAVYALWERAADRGEVRPDAPGWRIVNDVSYVVLWRILVYHDHVLPEHVEELVRRNVGSALTAEP